MVSHRRQHARTVQGLTIMCLPVRYGFRDDPLLFVTARPKLGARQVKLTHVTDWIEKKLKQEFKVIN